MTLLTILMATLVVIAAANLATMWLIIAVMGRLSALASPTT